MADACYDLSRHSAHSVAAMTVACRLLWLLQWLADAASKARLAKLPFKGKLLFGEDLDKLVKDLGKVKPQRLPEDKPRSSFRRSGQFHIQSSPPGPASMTPGDILQVDLLQLHLHVAPAIGHSPFGASAKERTRIPVRQSSLDWPAPPADGTGVSRGSSTS